MNFPHIKTIDDVLPFVQHRDEFVVAEREWGIAVDYQVSMPDSFETPQARECRGIKFTLGGKLLARPYHKFFNFGEPQMQIEDLAASGRFHEPFDILEKLDGSMIHPIVVDDEVLFCTRMGTTDVANQALLFATPHRDPVGTEPWYLDFCYDLAKSSLTPIFEWCSRQQRIVLDYPQSQLILTAVRANNTGEYLKRDAMRSLADPYFIPMVDVYTGDWDGIHSFMEHVRDLQEAEGYVFRWHDGAMGKTKGQWYVDIHRAKDTITHEKRIVALILNDDLDDVLPFLLSNDYDRVINYRKDFWENIDRLAETINTDVSAYATASINDGMHESEARKNFATEFVPSYTDSSSLRKLLFQAWKDEKPLREEVVNLLRFKFSLDVPSAKANGTQDIVDELRSAEILPKKDWRDY